MLLALGCWVNVEIQEKASEINCPVLLALCFITGCFYIAFFSMNRENTEIFRYTIWGNTNIFSCLYITPVFYLIMAKLRNFRINADWLHRIISTVGQCSYYILCTQMIMFWIVGKIWGLIDAPLAVSITCNIVLSVVSGIFIHWFVNKYSLSKA